MVSNIIQADSRSPFIRKFLISENHINLKIGSSLQSTTPSSNEIFSKWWHFRKYRKSTPSLFF
jgi:hypothetical protein